MDDMNYIGAIDNTKDRLKSQYKIIHSLRIGSCRADFTFMKISNSNLKKFKSMLNQPIYAF